MFEHPGDAAHVQRSALLDGAPARSARRHATTRLEALAQVHLGAEAEQLLGELGAADRLVTKTSSCGRYSGSMLAPVISSSMPTSSRDRRASPVPMLKNVSVASAFSDEDVRPRDVLDVDEVVGVRAVAVDQRRQALVDPVEHLHDHAHVRALVVHPRPVDVHVAVADVVEPVALVERAEELLAGDLRRAVHRAVVEGVLLGHGLFDRVAVDRGRRGVDDLLDARLLGRLDHVVGADDVRLERLARLVHALVQPQRGEMERVVGALHEVVEQVEVLDRALDQRHAVVLQRAGEVVAGAAHEVVEHDDLAHRLGQQLVDDVRADEAGTADDQHAGVFDRGHSVVIATALAAERCAHAPARMAA